MHRNLDSEMEKNSQNCQFGLLLAITSFLNNDLSAPWVLIFTQYVLA